jgi:PTS system cellobiose-specific IIB component
MKKLYIFCSAGMSSSLLADKMQKFANEKKLGVEVKFFPESQIRDNIKLADIALLSPQVKYLQKGLEQNYANKNIYLIEMMDYGLLNAESILNKCLTKFPKL